MSAWDELRKIQEEVELRKLVREFLKKEIAEAMGSGNSTADDAGDTSDPQEQEVEGTY